MVQSLTLHTRKSSFSTSFMALTKLWDHEIQAKRVYHYFTWHWHLGYRNLGRVFLYILSFSVFYPLLKFFTLLSCNLFYFWFVLSSNVFLLLVQNVFILDYMLSKFVLSNISNLSYIILFVLKTWFNCVSLVLQKTIGLIFEKQQLRLMFSYTVIFINQVWSSYNKNAYCRISDDYAVNTHEICMNGDWFCSMVYSVLRDDAKATKRPPLDNPTR